MESTGNSSEWLSLDAVGSCQFRTSMECRTNDLDGRSLSGADSQDSSGNVGRTGA